MSWARSDANRRALLRMLSPNAGERILDVGAGTGRVAAFVKRSCPCEVYALDPNRKKVAAATSQHPGLLTLGSASEAIPCADQSFDKAYSTMAFHHLHDKARSVSEIARVVRASGLLVVADVDPGSRAGKVIRFWENSVMRSGLGFLAPSDLTSLLTARGEFKVNEVGGTRSVYIISATRTSAPPGKAALSSAGPGR